MKAGLIAIIPAVAVLSCAIPNAPHETAPVFSAVPAPPDSKGQLLLTTNVLPTAARQQTNRLPVVYVQGEFRRQGTFPWTNGMTLKDAIDAAGFTDFSGHRLRLYHLDGTIERYRLRGDMTLTNNPSLKPGDKIFLRGDLF